MGDRAELESAIADDVRALSAATERIGKAFAGVHSMSANDFRALLHVMVAEQTGAPLSAGELRDLMIDSGNLRRESDPHDRRKVILKYADHGLELARQFFTPLERHTQRALADLPDRDLRAAHRVLIGVLRAMRDFETDLDLL